MNYLFKDREQWYIVWDRDEKKLYGKKNCMK